MTMARRRRAPPRLTTPFLPPTPSWQELPPKQREELLRILGRMLTERIDQAIRRGETSDSH